MQQTPALTQPDLPDSAIPLDAERNVRWYALYTRPRHEKRVCQQLGERHIESFLPMLRTVHRWKDRNQEVSLPLFPGYLFIRLDLRERLKALQLPGAIRLVGSNGAPAPVPQGDLEAVRNAIEGGAALERHPYLSAGRRVRVVRGILAGADGILIRRKGARRLVISIDLIQRSVAVEVNAGDVISIAEPRGRAAGSWPERPVRAARCTIGRLDGGTGR